MGRLCSIDGVHFAPDEAKVSVYDRGFLYGDSVFETIRTYGGEPYALGEHVARLGRSAERVAIDMPISAAEFGMEIRKAIRAARNPESYARAMLTRGSGPLGLDTSLAAAPVRVILIEPLHLPAAELYREGVKVVVVRASRASDDAHGAKVGNYLGSLLALKEAKAAGAHEALVLDGGGKIVEGTTSNVFVVKGREVVTPPEQAGILAGITRAHLLEVAKARGFAVRFESLSPEEVAAADEVFLSSSIREVMPVVRLLEKTRESVIGSGRPGPVTRELHARFREQVGVGGEPMPWE